MAQDVFAQNQEDLELREEQAIKQATALVAPSVVQIQTVGGLTTVGNLMTSTGPTTGLIVSPDGFILSSAFNFISKPTSILVTLPDQRRFAAKLVANDRARMLTLLKIETTGLPVARPAKKSSMQVGQWSIAMGRTYSGPLPSVSVGIVSALNRIWGKAIQTDAKVSPVNYGGPLVDIDGRVMGILVPLSSRTRQSTEAAGVEWYDSGIGFAIPYEDILATIDRLKAGEDLHPGLVGVSFKSRDMIGVVPTIDRVHFDSPAHKAGLKTGDVIVAVDGQAVTRAAQVHQKLGTKLAGDKIAMTIKRDDKSVEAEITLIDKLVPYEFGFLGVLPTRPAVSKTASTGVIVRHVFEGSAASNAKLKKRDRIVKFNEVDIKTAADLYDSVSRLRPDDKAKLVYVRDDQEATVEVSLTGVPEKLPITLSPSIIPSPKADAEEESDDKEAKPKADEGDNEGLKLGRFSEEDSEDQMAFWAYVPSEYNADYSYAMMVWIHPARDTMEAAVFKEWKTYCDQRGIILLAPKAEDVNRWSPTDAEPVKRLIERFQNEYSIDASRIAIHSYASGSGFAAHLAIKYREMVRGLSVAAGAFPLRQPPENRPDMRLQFHLMCGDKDRGFAIVQRILAILKAGKLPVTMSAIPGLAHAYPPSDRVSEIAIWMDLLDRI